MAGLPIVTARVSSELCTKYRIAQSNGIAFEIFRLIESALKEPLPDFGRPIDSLRKQLVNEPEKSIPHAAELRKHWYFIESAIRSALCTTDARFDSLPFRVFAEYCRRCTSHTVSEALRAEAESLEYTAPIS